jgi:hypothetical protein
MALDFEAQGDAQPVVDALAPHIGEQAWREYIPLASPSPEGIIYIQLDGSTKG